MKIVTFREMTLDDRVSWGFSVLMALLGIGSIAVLGIGLGMPLVVVGVVGLTGMHGMRRRFHRRTDSAEHQQ